MDGLKVSFGSVVAMLLLVGAVPAGAATPAQTAETTEESEIQRHLKVLRERRQVILEQLEELKRRHADDPSFDPSATQEAQDLALIDAEIARFEMLLVGDEPTAPDVEEVHEHHHDYDEAPPVGPAARPEKSEVQIREVEVPEAKSPTTAVLLAIGATVLPVAVGVGIALGVEGDEALISGLVLAGLGAVIGPSSGHFYAGESARGWLSAGGRLLSFGGGAALTALGVLAGDTELGASGVALALGGLTLIVIDIVDAPAAAERANKQPKKTALRVTPTVETPRYGAKRYGVSLMGQF